jgi:diadenosine tetraphosphate (Ap4A) HIT family hydrolase
VGEFVLDPAFTATSAELGELPLCHARLQLDARYPWIVLIPRLYSTSELYQLHRDESAQLMEEIARASLVVRYLDASTGAQADKINVGALGNITRQLHVHVIGRRIGDPAWPGPVWGHSPAQAYAPEALERAVATAREGLGL